MAAAEVSPWERIAEKLRAATAGELIVGGELGRGGMAAVFLAYDRHLDRRVAVKVMAPELLLHEELVERFTAEAATMANLRHPNIVAVHAVRRLEDLRFFVMEFVAGRSLDRILQHTGPLPLALARGIVSQVGSALAYAHRRGVTHRDVKPGNILVDHEGTALVTDFGIAKAVESSMRTHTGVLLGTPAYMSPEQCYGMPVTPASDQYSLGVLVYEMLTGRLPFEGTPFVVMQAHALEPVPPPRELRPDLPEDLERALLRLLAKSSHERFPSMRDAVEALGAYALDENDPLRADVAALASLGEPPAATRDALTPTGRRRDVGAAAVPGDTAPRPHLVLSDPPVAIAPGDEFRLSAFLCLENGTIVDDRVVTWTSSDPRVALEVRTTGAPLDRHVAARRNHRWASAAAAVALGVLMLGVVTMVSRGEPDRTEPIPRTRDAPSSGHGSRERAGAGASRSAGVDSMLHRLTSPPGTDAPSADLATATRVVVRQSAIGERRADRSGARVVPGATPGVSVAASEPPPVPNDTVAAPPVQSTTTVPERAESVAVRVADGPSEDSIHAAASRCASAVQSRNAERLVAVVTADAATRDDLGALLALLRDQGAQLRISAPVLGARHIGQTSAGQEVEVRFAWRSSFGRSRGAAVTLRGVVERTPSGWEATACRLVRSSGLR